jgi:hypothetical protein
MRLHTCSIALLSLLAVHLAPPGAAAARPPRPEVTVLPLPARDLAPPEQDLVLANIAVQLRQQYRVKVVSGRAVGRAVWGTMGSGIEAAEQRFGKLVRRGRQAYQKLQMGRALELLRQARQPLERCGAELESAELLIDLFVYTGLALLAQGQTDAAKAEFRQAVALDNAFQLSPREFPPDAIEAFERAKQALLSGAPTQVKVLSRPEGADVWIDGQRRGASPVDVPLYPGQHYVRVHKPGFSPWTLNLPDGVAPGAIRARLMPLWSGDPPADLLDKAIAREPLGEGVRARLRLMAGQYKTDAFLLVSMSKSGDAIHLGTRLFVLRPEIETRARLFNLGADRNLMPKKIEAVVATLKPLAKARARGGSGPAVAAAGGASGPSGPSGPAGGAGGGPADPAGAAGSGRPAPAAAIPHDEAPVPIDEQSDGPAPAWYESWWFWTVTGVVVAGAAAGTAAYFLTRPEGDWTLVVQPN